MSNNCGCNREFGFNDRSFDRDFDWDDSWNRSNRSGCGCGCGFNDDSNDSSALFEAECVARAALRRRSRENRCAREFVRCMRNARCSN